MRYDETVITTAGVFRCCIASVGREYAAQDVSFGVTSQCVYCKQPFTLRDINGKAVWLPDWQVAKSQG